MKQKGIPLELFGCLLLLLPLGFTIIWWSNFRGYFMNPSSYAKTNGVITKSRLTYSAGKGGSFSYDITYEYSVEAQHYVSSQVTFGVRGAKDISFAQSYIRRYALGQPVTVLYQPQEPSFAVLEPNNKQGTTVVLLFTAFLYVLGLSLIGIGMRKRRKKYLTAS